MRYTDLTNEELDALVEMSKALSTKRISRFTFEVFISGLLLRVSMRVSSEELPLE